MGSGRRARPCARHRHGVRAARVPGLTVDVYANGQELIPNFTPGTLAGPLDIPAGTYDLQVFPDGQAPGSGPPAIQAQGVQVPAGANATLAAHLDEAGNPKLTVFVNDTSPVGAGKARVTVRHVAAVPAVDVRAGGAPVISGLTNPNEQSLVVDAGTIAADVTLAGTGTVVLGRADLSLAEGTSTILRAWGSASQNNLALAVQTIEGLHSTPAGVPGGEAGLIDDDSAATSSWLAAAAIAGALGVAVAVLLQRPRAARVARRDG